jgi:uncharacterized membrane protein
MNFKNFLKPDQPQFFGMIYKKTSYAIYQMIFELILMILYFYLLSCLIVWIYDKYTKKVKK